MKAYQVCEYSLTCNSKFMLFIDAPRDIYMCMSQKYLTDLSSFWPYAFCVLEVSISLISHDSYLGGAYI